MKLKKINWKYAVSEIAIVSVGILIAFFINNWSSSIKKKNTFHEYKNGLVIDLEQNIENLDRIINLQERKVERLNLIISMTQNEEVMPLKNAQVDTISSTLLEQRKSPTFFPITGTFRALVSHGEIDLFSIDVKRSLFNLFDTNYSRTVYNGNLYDEIYVNTYDPLIHSIIDLRTENFYDVKELHSADFARDVLIIIDEADSYLGLLRSTKNASKQVLELIQN